MEVNGQLLVAGFERLTADPTGANLFTGRAWMRTDLATDQYRVYDGSQVEVFADTQSAQTFQNKILAGANIADYIEFDQQGSTPSNPAAGKNRIYFKTDGTPYTLDENGNEVPLGSGGGGSKNYFEDVDAEIDSTIGSWETDDGVGGSSAGLTLSVTAVAGELLAGTNSLKLVKDAADRDGHFIKVSSKTIDPSDRGRANYGSFEFRPGTGYVSSDLIFEVYDVTNAAVLYSGVAEDLELLNARGRFDWVTYLEDTTAQVEFRVKINNTNTNGFDAFFDEFKFGPAAQLVAPYDREELIDVTGSGAFTGGSIRVARIGGVVSLTVVTPVTHASLGFALSGVGIIPDWAAPDQQAYNTYEAGGAGAIKSMGILANGSFWFEYRDYAGSTVAQTTSGAGGVVSYPVEATSGIVNTNELSQQTVNAAGAGNGGTVLTANVTDIDFTEFRDSHSAFNGTQFTAPKSGMYSATGMVYFTGGVTLGLNAYINNAFSKTAAVTPGSVQFLPFSWEAFLNKGDTVSFRVDTGATLSNLTSGHWLEITSNPDYTVLGVVKNEETIRISANIFAIQNLTANVWQDITSFVLPEGEWHMHGEVGHNTTGGVPPSLINLAAGISTTAGNSNAGMSYLDGTQTYSAVPAVFYAPTQTVLTPILKVNSPTTYYLKQFSNVTTTAIAISYYNLIFTRKK